MMHQKNTAKCIDRLINFQNTNLSKEKATKTHGDNDMASITTSDFSRHKCTSEKEKNGKLPLVCKHKQHGYK